MAAESAIMSRAELMEALERSKAQVDKLTSILADTTGEMVSMPKCSECLRKRNDFLANALDEGVRR